MNKAGRVAVRGTVKANGRTRTVLAASKRSRAAGRVKLGLRLSKRGREQLARTGRLRVSLAVRFSGVSEAEVMSLALVKGSTRGRGR